MFEPIKIVTAFFDIGRGKYDSYCRTNDQYLTYFKFWACIQNYVIIYCDPQYADRIREIRTEYGRETQTEIHIIDNVFSVEEDMLNKMLLVEMDSTYNSFRYYNGDNPSNKAKYNYIMLMKWWCMKDAASRLEQDDMIAWVDFGYDHGGSRYVNSNDFDFLWHFEKSQKITEFCLSNPDDISLIESLQFENDCFLGHTAIIPAFRCEEYYSEMCNAMRSLLMIGCMDDDQYLMLMVYRNHKEWFDIKICDWFEDFSKFSGHAFEQKEKTIDCKNEQIKVNLLYRVKNTIKRIIRKIKAPEYNITSFILRQMEKEKKYYN